MTTLSGLREEHRELLVKIEQLKLVADLIDVSSVENIIKEITEVDMFLERDLLTHAKAEEDVLYHAYDQVAESPWATDTMRRDHAAVASLAGELVQVKSKLSGNQLTAQEKHDLSRILYGLHTLLRQHFANEEEIILPRVEKAVTQEAADQLVRSMEAAAKAHRGHLQQH